MWMFVVNQLYWTVSLNRLFSLTWMIYHNYATRTRSDVHIFVPNSSFGKRRITYRACRLICHKKYDCYWYHSMLFWRKTQWINISFALTYVANVFLIKINSLTTDNSYSYIRRSQLAWKLSVFVIDVTSDDWFSSALMPLRSHARVYWIL